MQRYLLRCQAARTQALVVRGHLHQPTHKLTVLNDGLPLQVQQYRAAKMLWCTSA